MKTTLILLFVVAGIAVAHAALTCVGDKEKCAEDECCLQVGPVYVCKKHREDGKRCEMHPIKSLIKDHVYKVMCPCAAGLKCVAKDGIVGKVMGTCQESSEEVVTEAE